MLWINVETWILVQASGDDETVMLENGAQTVAFSVCCAKAYDGPCYLRINAIPATRSFPSLRLDKQGIDVSNRTATPIRQSYATQENIVLPGDTNAHDTLFGGELMKRIDETAAISARRHCKSPVVTASNDGVHFHRPIRRDDIVTLQSYVCSVGRTSMEIFIKISTENTLDGTRHVAAISFLTFVALDENGKPKPVAGVLAESTEEKLVNEGRETRRAARMKKREETNELLQAL